MEPELINEELPVEELNETPLNAGRAKAARARENFTESNKQSFFSRMRNTKANETLGATMTKTSVKLAKAATQLEQNMGKQRANQVKAMAAEIERLFGKLDPKTAKAMSSKMMRFQRALAKRDQKSMKIVLDEISRINKPLWKTMQKLSDTALASQSSYETFSSVQKAQEESSRKASRAAAAANFTPNFGNTNTNQQVVTNTGQAGQVGNIKNAPSQGLTSSSAVLGAINIV